MSDEDQIHYHHFSFNFPIEELARRLADVRLLLVAGCARRARAQAHYLATPTCEQLTREESRFALYKAGPALVANHGMGPASMSIALHELLLMCRQAGRLQQLTVVRFGTCGGLGVAPGTVCVTNRALDPLLQDYVELKICLRLVRRPATVDQATSQLLERLARDVAREAGAELGGEFAVRAGATIGTNDFYEEQGRLNGAICEHSSEDRDRFLEAARAAGVVNIEMESNYLAAMCHKLDVKFGVICVALNDRLDRQASTRHGAQRLADFERRLFAINKRLVELGAA